MMESRQAQAELKHSVNQMAVQLNEVILIEFTGSH